MMGSAHAVSIGVMNMAYWVMSNFVTDLQGVIKQYNQGVVLFMGECDRSDKLMTELLGSSLCNEATIAIYKFIRYRA